MACGTFDNAELIGSRNRGEAIEDGTLIPYQFHYLGEMVDCCFSRGVWEKYRHNQTELKRICRKGMRRLTRCDEADTWGRKRCVLAEENIWASEDVDGLIIYLYPKEY